MTELFEFLNSQSSDRLVGYGVIFLTTVYFVMQSLTYMIHSIFSKPKSKKIVVKEKIEKSN